MDNQHWQERALQAEALLAQAAPLLGYLDECDEDIEPLRQKIAAALEAQHGGADNTGIAACLNAKLTARAEALRTALDGMPAAFEKDFDYMRPDRRYSVIYAWLRASVDIATKSGGPV